MRCIGFSLEDIFPSQLWEEEPEVKGISQEAGVRDEKLRLITEGCDPLRKDVKRETKDIFGEVSKTHHAIHTLDKMISNLEMELSAARSTQESIMNGSPISDDMKIPESTVRRKYLMVLGINAAFSSCKQRDSVRATWMPQGDKRKKLEEKGIVMHFVIGHSPSSADSSSSHESHAQIEERIRNELREEMKVELDKQVEEKLASILDAKMKEREDQMRKRDERIEAIMKALNVHID